MTDLEKIINYIETNTLDLESLNKLETFINQNKIELNSNDYLELLKKSSKLKEIIKTLLKNKNQTSNIFIKTLKSAYKVIKSNISLEDKTILESLRFSFDASLRDVIFYKYKNTVKQLAKVHCKNQKDLQDTLQDYYETLLSCINNYDIENNYSFREYLIFNINFNRWHTINQIETCPLTHDMTVNNLEDEIILQDLLDRFSEIIMNDKTSTRNKEILYLLSLPPEQREQELKNLNSSARALNVITKNAYRRMLRTTIFDEYTEYLDNPKSGKEYLESERLTKKRIADIKGETKDFEILKELVSMGTTEDEVATAIGSLYESEKEIIYLVSGNDLNHPIDATTLSKEQLVSFYYAKKELISIISSKKGYQIQRNLHRNFLIYIIISKKKDIKKKKYLFL